MIDHEGVHAVERVSVGALFPQQLASHDIGGVRALLEAVEALGFASVMVFDHVAGTRRERLAELPVVPYDYTDPFHEALALSAFAAAITSRLELRLGVLVLPQRQTLLAAKQLATIQILSGGRLHVGLGVGWNPAEYAALGRSFGRRGAILDEQVPLLRALWIDELVDADGTDDTWTQIGLQPRPDVPIPLWFGGPSRAAMRRVVRWGAGWIAPVADTETGRPCDHRALVAQLAGLVGAANRAEAVQIEGRIVYSGEVTLFGDELNRWRQLGADRVTVSLAGGVAASYDDAIAAYARIAEQLT